MKTSDIEGSQLALWVAKALGWNLFEMAPGEFWYSLFEQPGGGEGPIGTVETGAAMFEKFQPHEDWTQGGPLIEEYRIDLMHDGRCAMIDGDRYAATYYCTGPTILVAAMRTLVASVYGETLPGEII